MDFNLAVQSLFDRQLSNWELAATNFAALQKIRVRTLAFNDFEIRIQFNPHRIISSSARVDPGSVSTRPCFLCEKNRPTEQLGIRYRDQFILLVNPYPVFQGHLTIPALQHEPQLILSSFGRMLELVRDLKHYTLIYNGPRCGASAPDHMHFQALPGGNLPIETDFQRGIQCKLITENQQIRIYTWPGYLRNLITLQGKEPAVLESMFLEFCSQLNTAFPSDDEPMMNILACYRESHYVIHFIPRKLHRPDRYFAAGDSQLLLSPASIDLGGVLIMPREEDYLKVTHADIWDVFQQVCVGDDIIQYLLQKLTRI
jgi:hypothetical protein